MGVKPEVKEHLAQRASNGMPEVWQAPLSEIRKNTQLESTDQLMQKIYPPLFTFTVVVGF
jgi:hypothetical protein